MTTYILKRLVSMVPVLFLVSIVIFSLIHLTPGDPVVAMLGEEATPEARDRLRAQLGLDQPILVIGAMVLGPEFGALAAICFGTIVREPLRVLGATRTLVVGFAVGIAVTVACAVVSRWLGWIDAEMLTDRPATEFIVHPDRWSFIVAVLAGIAGTLSITAGKSSPLVGVFISVTTIPAAGNIAVGVALAKWDEVGGSSVQLAVNVFGLLIAGTATLLVQRLLWSRYGRHVLRRSASPRRKQQLS